MQGRLGRHPLRRRDADTQRLRQKRHQVRRATAEEGEASLAIRELTLNINASVNDAINAEQYLAVESGTLNLATADVALHCDLIMDIGAEGTDGPTIAIAEACEGIEAAALSIRSSDISIVCTDDCLNAANSDLANYDFAINISGGTIVAYTTAGDGFDSNGSLTISGGSAGMGMNLSTTQAYVTFGSAGISGMGNMGGQPGSFGGMQPPAERQPAQERFPSERQFPAE